MLMVLFGIDFGRVFLGWVTLNQAVREAANFAAYNPNGWSPANAGVVAEYERLITTEAAAINCVLPNPLPDPTFPSGTGIGDPVVVAITCQFTLLTPLVGFIVGQPLDVSASASFPIRSGAIQGIPLSSTVPGSPGPTVDPSESVDPSVDPSPTAVPDCPVPDLFQVRSQFAVRDFWEPAGFNPNNLLFTPIVPPHYRIGTQSIPANDSVPCDSTMTVTP
jgi:hypothetical protein